MYSLFYIKVHEFHNTRYNFHERNVISISKEKKLLTEKKFNAGTCNDQAYI